MESKYIRALVTSEVFKHARNRVVCSGYTSEIKWANAISPDDIDEDRFLAETGWVILNSGFRASVIDKIGDAFQEAFLGFVVKQVVGRPAYCRDRALAVFGNKRKVEAIITAARLIDTIGWGPIKSAVNKDGPEYLKTFPFIGPITCFHLARNIGFDCVKPDRHLVRMADSLGYDTPLAMCQAISDEFKMRLGAVDVILWRWATIETNYMEVIESFK